MISRLRGTLLEKEDGRIEVMTRGGVGYSVSVPDAAFERIPGVGEEVELRTKLVVREDAQTLYGFLEKPERELFQRVLLVRGIGPALAMAMLGTYPWDVLAKALATRNTGALVRIPGVGKKTAERLALELAERVRDLVPKEGKAKTDSSDVARRAKGALMALGYSSEEAARAIRRTLGAEAPESVDALVRSVVESHGRR